MSLPRRIQVETERIKSCPPGCALFADASNPRYFKGKIAGPADSPYEGGVFELEIFLPDGYPQKALQIRFLTPIYHPNIDELGRICLDLLKSDWKPITTMANVLVTLRGLLSSPNPSDPLDVKIAKHWTDDEQGAKQKAIEWTRKYASNY
ncbi:hypothetical protein WA158_000065 [Blastocystis sp. Blastoise]